MCILKTRHSQLCWLDLGLLVGFRPCWRKSKFPISKPPVRTLRPRNECGKKRLFRPLNLHPPPASPSDRHAPSRLSNPVEVWQLIFLSTTTLAFRLDHASIIITSCGAIFYPAFHEMIAIESNAEALDSKRRYLLRSCGPLMDPITREAFSLFQCDPETLAHAHQQLCRLL
jgi:hypothetical protein